MSVYIAIDSGDQWIMAVVLDGLFDDDYGNS